MLGFGWIPPFSPFPQSSFWMIHKIESFAASLEYIPTKKFPSHSIKFISQKIPPKMRVCVIGAGVSGLPAIKACLEEGLEVKCFEKTSQIGGLWNYRPNEPNIGATVMGSTVVNTSKEMMAYSDFPPPPEWPNFMHHLWVQKYLEMYAAHFDLLKHIYFGKEVKKVERLSPMNWQVLLSDGTKEDFGAILICTGHHCDRNIPKLPGIDKFTGRIMHAQEYRDPHGFEGKNVFLLGIGNSALDIAVELAKIAKRVTISTRRGTWIFNRVIQWGLPYDVVYQTRFYNWLMDILPWSIANDFHEWRIQQRMDHDLYGLRPSHRFFQQHPAVNDSLANLLASGQITIADDISSIEEDSILVADGRKFETDILILCTGYSFGFPFLHPPDLIPVTENEVDLYKFVFPPSPMANGLAIIGLVQPIGSVAPISEMQARLAAATFSGRIRLPSEKEMRKEIEDRRRQMRRQYFESKKHTIQVKFIPYMDELAKIVGCMPDLKKLIWTEPGLALRLILGPNAPYVYRLEGPNRWEGARKAIAGLGERVKMPLKQRKSNNGKRKRMRKGMLDGGIFFAYSTIKCLALYLFIIFTFALWAFFPNGIGPFICFVSALAIIAGLAFLFQFDILWI